MEKHILPNLTTGASGHLRRSRFIGHKMHERETQSDAEDPYCPSSTSQIEHIINEGYQKYMEQR